MSSNDINNMINMNKLLVNDTFSRVLTAVRIRPLSTSEKLKNYQIIVSVNPENKGSLNILDPAILKKNVENKQDIDKKMYERNFKYDHSFWSVSDAYYYASQLDVYKACGEPLVEHCLAGLNCCILAFGQTGTGKTYTMMGNKIEDDKSILNDVGDDNNLDDISKSEGYGVIPRLCINLFRRVSEILTKSKEMQKNNYIKLIDDDSMQIRLQAELTASYIEIYNEKVFDLLSIEIEKKQMRVREHPDEGAYVEYLTKESINSLEDVEEIITRGNLSRATSATNMNENSSRSHAVFTLYLRQEIVCEDYNDDTQELGLNNEDKSGDVIINNEIVNKLKTSPPTTTKERFSKVCLVDLAGSERASLTGVVGERLREANNINTSLSTLGDVIKALSERATKKDIFIPYRNSMLTWLLKDSLGGNSKTTMLASISPHDASYNETLSTLRYIERVKLIVNHSVINEQSHDPKLIASLQKQVLYLQTALLISNSKLLQRENDIKDAVSSGTLDSSISTRNSKEFFTSRVSEDISPDEYMLKLLSLESEITRLNEYIVQQRNIIIENESLIMKLTLNVGNEEDDDDDNTEQRINIIVSTYKQEIDSINSNYDTLIQKFNSVTSTVQYERDKNAIIEDSYIKIENQLDILRDDLKNSKIELSLISKEKERLRDALEVKLDTIDNLLSEIEQSKIEFDKITKKMDLLESQSLNYANRKIIGDIIDQNIKLIENKQINILNSLELEVFHLKTNHLLLMKEKNEIIQNLNSDLKELKISLILKSESIASLEIKIDYLSKTIDSKIIENQAFENAYDIRIEELQNDLNLCNFKINDGKVLNESLEVQIRHLKEELIILKGEKEESVQLVITFEERIKELTEIIEINSIEKEKLELNLESLIHELQNELGVTINDGKKIRKSLEDQVLNLKYDVTSIANEKEKSIQKLSTSLNLLRSESITLLEVKVEELQKIVDSNMIERNILENSYKSRIQELQKEVYSFQSPISHNTNKIQETIDKMLLEKELDHGKELVISTLKSQVEALQSKLHVSGPSNVDQTNELINTKICYAQLRNDYDELQQSYRKLERSTCQLKLDLANTEYKKRD